MEPVIRVDHVTKSFKLPHERTSSLKGALLGIFRRGKKTYELQKALNDVSFEIRKGEFFGIVGRNGSGKSTLLKMLAGIYVPSSGHIQVNGKLTPFIELGVGFNPELTGRENVFLNGALLGFSHSEMEAKYDDIVSFAEIERFMDQKLKNYSSGMQVRLAFSIAIQAQSDILILDEVLAVGDEAFQQKCVSVFEKYKAKKQTIVLVTHDMSVVERFCSRALMLKDGKVVEVGRPSKVARMYSDSNKDAYATQKAKEDAAAAKLYDDDIDISILDPHTQQPKKRFKQGESVLVQLDWKRDNVLNGGVAIMKQSGEYVFGPNTAEDKFTLTGKRLQYEVQLNLGPGEYYLKAGLFGKTDSDVLSFVDVGPSLMVERADGPLWGGIAQLPHHWKN